MSCAFAVSRALILSAIGGFGIVLAWVKHDKVVLEVVEHSVDVLALLLKVEPFQLDSVQLNVDGLLLLLQQFLLLCQLSLTIQIRMIEVGLLGVHF